MRKPAAAAAKSLQSSCLSKKKKDEIIEDEFKKDTCSIRPTEVYIMLIICLIGKDSGAGRDWGQEEKGMTEDEMAGWHHRLDGRESE